jgi:alanine racemase
VGEHLARRLLALNPEELARAFALRGPTPRTDQRRSITDNEDPDQITFALPDGDGPPIVAGRSDPGLVRGARNEDAVAAHYDPDTGIVTVVVADGLSSGSDSGHAARVAVDAALDELTRTGLDRTPEQAHLLAAAMAAAQVAALAMPGQDHQPASSYLAVQIIPAGDHTVVITAHLGDTRAYLVPAGGAAEQLTSDSREFLGENPRTAPTLTTRILTTSGEVYVATDGLYSYFRSDDPAAVPGATAADRVNHLVRAALDGGGRDNLTAIDITIAPAEGQGRSNTTAQSHQEASADAPAPTGAVDAQRDRSRWAKVLGAAGRRVRSRAFSVIAIGLVAVSVFVGGDSWMANGVGTELAGAEAGAQMFALLPWWRGARGGAAPSAVPVAGRDPAWAQIAAGSPGSATRGRALTVLSALVELLHARSPLTADQVRIAARTKAGKQAVVEALIAKSHTATRADDRTVAAVRITAGGGPRGGDGAAIPGGFLPGEERRLKVALREAKRRGVVRTVDPAKLPRSPRAPPQVVLVPDAFLRERGLGRVVDNLAAYTVHTADGPVIFFTEGMFARLQDHGLLAFVLEIEIQDRVRGRRSEAEHQALVDAVLGRLTRQSAALAEAVVDLDAVAHNVRVAPAAELTVMIEDGDHGAVAVARTALAAGVRRLGVTSLREAFELRDAGIKAPVLAWMLTPIDDFEAAIRAGIDLSVSSPRHLAAIVNGARRAGTARVHLEVDTGLSRGGVRPEDWAELLDDVERAVADGLVQVVSVWSHLSHAEEAGHPTQDRQAELLTGAWQAARDRGLDPIRHLANSAATLSRSDLHFDLVRPGAALYGVDPWDRAPAESPLRPAMTLRARVARVNRVQAGQGHEWKAPRETKLAWVAIGYADAPWLKGAAGLEVLLGGVRRPVVDVTKYHLLVDLGSEGPGTTQEGDWSELFGPGEHGEPTAHEVAAVVGGGADAVTIVTDLMSHRIERAFTGSPSPVADGSTPQEIWWLARAVRVLRLRPDVAGARWAQGGTGNRDPPGVRR